MSVPDTAANGGTFAAIRPPPVPLGEGAFVATKFYVPAPRRGSVTRPALVARLEEGVEARLTVVAAPAGAGKTTLLAEWHVASNDERAFAWVSLEPADNDPVRFWSGVIQALRSVEPGIAGRTVAALAAPEVDPIEVALPHLVNELAALERQIVLVLDDYHLIVQERVHESVTFLLQHAPRNVHLVVASRTDPPLPLGRLRARGQMAEIRIEQLRFSEEEIDALLNGTMRIGLERSEVRRLREKTEGWAAGVYLAGLSLRCRDDASGLARAFAGDDRHVADFLVSEVLDRETEPVRTFLLRTSVLRRLCGDLCDVVAEMGGGARRLREIERSNLFLVPLDGRREWFRYHELFADLLRYELERSDPGLVCDLHRRAAAWHINHGTAAEAIHHAFQAGDVETANELIAAQWHGMLQSGQVETVRSWLDGLPEEVVGDDSRSCIARAWTFVFCGQLHRVERWTARAERGSHPGPYHIGTSLESAVAVLRAASSHLLGDVGGMLEAARCAVRLEPETAPSRGIALLLLGHAQLRQGALHEAQETFEAALSRGNEVGETAVMTALAHLAAIDVDHGDLDRAQERCERAVRVGEEHGASERWMMSWPLIARARVYERRGENSKSAADLERALVLARRGGARLETAEALVRMTKVRCALGDRRGAAEALRDAEMTVAACADPGMLAVLLASAASYTSRSRLASPGGEQLSERELAVLRLLPAPLSNREIGCELFVSLNTVKTHLRRIYQKLGAANRPDAIRRARELGLL